MRPPDRARRLTHQVASLLLSCPDERLLERLPQIRKRSAACPSASQRRCGRASTT